MRLTAVKTGRQPAPQAVLPPHRGCFPHITGGFFPPLRRWTGETTQPIAPFCVSALHTRRLDRWSFLDYAEAESVGGLLIDLETLDADLRRALETS